MAAFCLIKEQADKFKKGLKDGSINPEKMGSMSSAERRAYLEKFVGKENAKQVNGLFESKLLLKNKKIGYINWAKKVAGMTIDSKRDMISRIERMQDILDPKAENMFLEDLAAKRLGLEITEAQAKTLATLSKDSEVLRAKAKEDGTFPSESDRWNYGSNQAALEEYFNQLKLDAKSIKFREHPKAKTVEIIKESPGLLKSIAASLDNSFFGRQGIKTLYTHPIVWSRAFLKSWLDIGREFKGKNAMVAIKSDIYSRPNAVNGKYEAGGYGLKVLSEEAYPTSAPQKLAGVGSNKPLPVKLATLPIRVFGRLFTASETAYNGAALRIRADLADLLIKKADEMGINTLDPKEAGGMGSLVSSMTGRGNLPLTPNQAKATNVLFFSIKFLKSNFDTLTAHQLDSKANRFVKIEAALNLAKIVATTATILTISKLLNPDSVDEDPRSPNFGKVKVFGHWTDITGGMSGMLTLAAKLLPSYHDGELGFWKRNKDGTYTEEGSAFGIATPLDAFNSYIENKASPALGMVFDVWRQKTLSGQPVTVQTELLGKAPIPLQTLKNLLEDPGSEFVLGSMIMDALGLSVDTSVAPNAKTKLIPEGKKVNKDDTLAMIQLYARAIGADPETAFNRIFAGQKIMEVNDGGIVVVKRDQSIKEQKAFKAKYGDAKEVRNDHTIPIHLGGSDSTENTKFVSVALHASYSPVENALIKAVKKGKISRPEAQKLIVRFKKIEDASDRKEFGLEIRRKYK